MTEPERAPAGWYSDPAQQHEGRYWDGTGWTAQVSDGGITTTDLMTPASVPDPAQEASAAIPAGQAPGPPPAAAWAPVTVGTPAPAAPWALPTTEAQPAAGTPAQALPAAPGSVAGPDPGSMAPRRRRRWPLITLAAVVVLGLAAGLVIWAPWTPPPVLRPTGLAAGPATANSVSFHWSRPPTGPLPDKYLILKYPTTGSVVAKVPGSATSWRLANLDPATTYEYQLVAVRGGKRSPPSKFLAVSTLTPPVSEARLQGSWTINVNFSGPGGRGHSGAETGLFDPVCAAGACDVILHVQNGKFSFRVKLARVGAVYTGQTVANFYPCGSGATAIPDPLTMKFQMKVTAAQPDGLVWAATSLAGTEVDSYQYVSSSAGYCTAATHKAAVTATPGS